MRNIIRTDVILKLFAVLSIFTFVGCQNQIDGPTLQEDHATIMLDIDKLTLESASIRIRHNGPSDMLWVYMHTDDMETDAAHLIQDKVARELELTKEIVAERGQNKSLTVQSLLPKCYYRFICSAIDEITGMPCGEVAELEFRTRRDPSVFEKNDNWSISRGERYENNQDKMEYDNFICKSDDDQSYVFLTLKKSDFESYYQGDLRALFEDYHSSFGFETGSSKWKTVLSSGDITWPEQRLRSGDWTAYMIGIDTDGELSGLYQELKFTVEQEVATEEYNRWLGKWTVSDKNGEKLFDIDILPNENNMWYYMAGWESGNILQLDTYDSHLMPELFFDKTTYKLVFVSQYLNTMIDNGDNWIFYFSGTFTYGNSYVLGDEVLNYKMAEATLIGDSAQIAPLKFVTNGSEFMIESICYIYYLGDALGSISMAPPVLPLTMTKVAAAE